MLYKWLLFKGLACRLTAPGQRPRQRNIRSDGGEWEANRSEIKMEKKLGSGNFGVVYKGMELLDCQISRFYLLKVKLVWLSPTLFIITDRNRIYL